MARRNPNAQLLFGSHPETGVWNPEIAQQAMTQNIHNIISKYKGADPEHIRQGAVWYQMAHDHALRVGRGDIERGAGIIAALSPATSWARNLEAAHHVATTGTPHSYQTEANNTKAIRINAGEHPLDVLGGHKVRNFYMNIIDPSNREPITIDRHAHDIAIGKPFGQRSETEQTNLGLGAVGRYQHFVHAYRSAAGELGIEIPANLQAATWIAHRGTHL